VQTLSGALFAFCGVGNPEAFWEDLRRWGVNVVATKAFRDHHRYSHRDLNHLKNAAQACNAVGLVTTEKDAQNIDANLIAGLTIYVAVIELNLPDESQFMRDLNQRLAKSHGAHGAAA
jgi:tetraacyldisaccharide 4'-kinase